MRAACVLLAVGIATSTAAADGFAWQAPASCPAANDVLARIEHRLDRDTRVRDIEVTVVKARAGYSATIDTRAVSVAAHSRTLNAASCHDLADAVAVIVARLAIEAQRAVADAARAEPPPTPDAIGYIAPARRELEVQTTTLLVAPTSPAEWRGGLRLLAVSGIGVTPKVGYGGELAGYVQRGGAFAELGYARWAERPTSNAPAHLDIGVSLLALRGGWASPQMPLRAWGGFEIGAMHGAPQGIQASMTTAIPASQGSSGRWIAATSGFGVSWPMTPHLRLTGTFEVAVPLATAEFRFADGSQIYEPDPISARCALGLEVTWQSVR